MPKLIIDIMKNLNISHTSSKMNTLLTIDMLHSLAIMINQDMKEIWGIMKDHKDLLSIKTNLSRNQFRLSISPLMTEL